MKYLITLLENFKLVFYLAVVALIVSTIAMVQCEGPQETPNLYKGGVTKLLMLKTKTEVNDVLILRSADWTNDTTMTQQKMDHLNILFER